MSADINIYGKYQNTGHLIILQCGQLEGPDTLDEIETYFARMLAFQQMESTTGITFVVCTPKNIMNIIAETVPDGWYIDGTRLELEEHSSSSYDVFAFFKSRVASGKFRYQITFNPFATSVDGVTAAYSSSVAPAEIRFNMYSDYDQAEFNKFMNFVLNSNGELHIIENDIAPNTRKALTVEHRENIFKLTRV